MINIHNPQEKISILYSQICCGKLSFSSFEPLLSIRTGNRLHNICDFKLSNSSQGKMTIPCWGKHLWKLNMPFIFVVAL